MTADEIRALTTEERLRIARQLELCGDAPLFLKCISDLFLLAGYDITVLIEGETGTGKELFARALHQIGPRGSRAFVSVNCAAFPSELLESEFFGHRRGAYTHAYEFKRGMVAEADGGTLFLDEIASLEWRLQAKLLRFVQSREYRPVGASRTHTADTRIIVASNTPLREEAQNNAFRWDLYYRLAVFALRIPPLRDRPQDILPLTENLMAKHAAEFGLQLPRISDEAATALCAYSWPGNVRELENAIQHALLRCGGEVIGKAHLPPEVLLEDSTTQSAQAGRTFREQKLVIVHRFERKYLENLLVLHAGNLTHAAQTAGKDRRALAALLKKYGLQRSAFAPPRS